MHIQTIYDQLNIMPQLQLHMYRVAAVGVYVAQNMTMPIDLDLIKITCLVHDLGNIIKFNLNLYPENTAPQGLAYWQQVQQDYIKKYGLDEHLATKLLAKEIGCADTVLAMLDSIGFSKTITTENSNDYNLKIITYADNRVTPFGITSLTERLLEGRKRYHNRLNSSYLDKRGADQFTALFTAATNVEKQIFAHAQIQPEDVNEQNLAAIISALSSTEI